MKILDCKNALDLKMGDNDADAETVRDYLYCLLKTLWIEQEGFSGKRPFGNSGWEWDVYKPLIVAGYLEGKIDEDGYISSVDEKRGHLIVMALIEQAFYGIQKSIP